MQQRFCTQTPLPQDPRVWGQKIKIQLFQNMVMLHYKLKGISNVENPDPRSLEIGEMGFMFSDL